MESLQENSMLQSSSRQMVQKIIQSANNRENQYQQQQSQQHSSNFGGILSNFPSINGYSFQSSISQQYQQFISSKNASSRQTSFDNNNAQQFPQFMNYQQNALKSVETIRSSGSQKLNSNQNQIQSSKGCQCKQSQCLKFYCVCFRNKNACSDACSCQNCKNYEGSIDRDKEMDKILKDNKDAFQNKFEEIDKPNILNSAYINKTLFQQNSQNNKAVFKAMTVEDYIKHQEELKKKEEEEEEKKKLLAQQQQQLQNRSSQSQRQSTKTEESQIFQSDIQDQMQPFNIIKEQQQQEFDNNQYIHSHRSSQQPHGFGQLQENLENLKLETEYSNKYFEDYEGQAEQCQQTMQQLKQEFQQNSNNNNNNNYNLKFEEAHNNHHINAMQQRQIVYKNGCTCKKTHCKKKYCECFNSGLKCSHKCVCKDCHNMEEIVPDEEYIAKQVEVKMMEQKLQEINKKRKLALEMDQELIEKKRKKREQLVGAGIDLD